LGNEKAGAFSEIKREDSLLREGEHKKEEKREIEKTIIIIFTTERPSQPQKKHKTLPMTPSSNGRHQPPP